MSVDTIVATAKNLQGLISQHLKEGDTRAHITPEVVAAVGKAGMFRLYAPKEVGGLEVPPPISLAALEAIAAADPAVAWYMANSVPACLAAASLSEAERSELFADKDLNFGFSAAVLGRANPTDGGYSLSGQWPVVTGCEDSKWCALAGLVMDGDTPRQQAGQPDGRLFLVRTKDIQISQTWQGAAAMRGTGSNAVVVNQLFVSETFAYSPSKPLVIDRPLFKLPFSLVFGSAPAAIICGVLSSALESTTAALGTKVSSITGRTLRDQAPIQELIAECSGALRAARAELLEASSNMGARECWRGGPKSRARRTPRIRISRGGGRARDDQPFVYPRDACGVYAREPRRAGPSQYSCDSIHVRKRAEFSSCSGPSADGWRPSRPIVLKENEETAAVAI